MEKKKRKRGTFGFILELGRRKREVFYHPKINLLVSFEWLGSIPLGREHIGSFLFHSRGTLEDFLEASVLEEIPGR